MSSISRFAGSVVIATAIALLLISVPLLFRSRDAGPPTTEEPAPQVTAVAGDIASVPEVSSEARASAASAIGSLLEVLYTRAFVRTEPGPGTPPPDVTPSKQVTSSGLLTKAARDALTREPAVFDEVADLAVFTGTIDFSGLVTFDGDDPIGALIELDFRGDAAPIGRNVPLMRVRQRGTMDLVRVDGRWAVGGYELHIATRALATPSPSPS